MEWLAYLIGFYACGVAVNLAVWVRRAGVSYVFDPTLFPEFVYASLFWPVDVLDRQ